MKLKLIAGLLVLAFAFSSTAWAASEAEAHGIVKAVNEASKSLKISHDAIKDLNMAAMTMDFPVADPAMLDDVKVGDEIDFVVSQDRSGRFVVTDMEVLK